MNNSNLAMTDTSRNEVKLIASDQKGMTSLEIAEVTGKQHAHVMRDIRNLLSQGVAESNFGLGSYTDANNQERPLFNLTPKGCLILASGYDAVLREKIIDRLEVLESGKPKVPQSFAEALMLAARQQMQIEEQQKQIEQKEETIELQQKELTQSAPKVSYYDSHLQSVNTQTSTQAAKQIGMDAEKLHKKLKEIGIIYRQSGQWILHAPYSTWGMHSTRTQTYTRSDGSIGTSVYTVWTQRGVRFIIALYENGWNVKKAIKQIKGGLDPAA